MEFLNSESAASMSFEETAQLLKTDLEYGISYSEINERRKLYSYNEFEVGASEPLWQKYLEKFKEPMILLLLASAFVSVVMKQFDDALSITIAISMLVVIVIAALIGTFVPIILDRKGIDPAIATGPFITTSNDIFGIFLFFYIAKLILGF